MLLLVLYSTVLVQIVSAESPESDANAFLRVFNKRAPIERNKHVIANWKYSSNVSSEEAIAEYKAASLAYETFLEEAQKIASNVDNLEDLPEDIQRQIKLIRLSGILKDLQKRKKLHDIKTKMRTIYNAAQVEDHVKGKNLSLAPDLTNIMASSHRYDQLKFAWQSWRDAVGPKIRPLYEEYVSLANEGAKDNNFSDYGAFWRESYEVDNLPELVRKLWKELEPLYKELHAYVRDKLANQYPQVKEGYAIPAHLLGNMWAQSWVNIYPLVKPYKNTSTLDVTKTMNGKNYTIEDMFRITESSFVSLGLEKLPKKFLERSMIRKPEGREVDCLGSAWDMLLKTKDGEKDVRIHQCTDVTQEWLLVTHREMGHVYYFMSYWDQPFIYRDGANPGFLEAVGNAISLSVSTPQHLHKIGLLKDYVPGEGLEINALMKMALDIIAFLPFAYLIDQWRWSVFQGKIKPDEYNTKWWKLRTRYQGVKPPLERTVSDFDPGAMYHIPSDVPYIRYFISTVLQFQFHKAACQAAGFEGPLHQCSICKSTEAGRRISEMLKLGKSNPWPEALERLTNKRSVDAGPLKEYFWPLYLWLRAQRCTSEYKIGWPENPGPEYDPCVVPTTLPAYQGVTPPNTQRKSKGHTQILSNAGKLIMAVFAVLLSLNLQYNQLIMPF